MVWLPRPNRFSRVARKRSCGKDMRRAVPIFLDALTRPRLHSLHIRGSSAVSSSVPSMRNESVMPFIIWGSRGITSELSCGEIFCPQCDAQEEYTLKQVRPYFTLYFIP